MRTLCVLFEKHQSSIACGCKGRAGAVYSVCVHKVIRWRGTKCLTPVEQVRQDLRGYNLNGGTYFCAHFTAAETSFDISRTTTLLLLLAWLVLACSVSVSTDAGAAAGASQYVFGKTRSCSRHSCSCALSMSCRRRCCCKFKNKCDLGFAVWYDGSFVSHNFRLYVLVLVWYGSADNLVLTSRTRAAHVSTCCAGFTARLVWASSC